MTALCFGSVSAAKDFSAHTSIWVSDNFCDIVNLGEFDWKDFLLDKGKLTNYESRPLE